jgi:hypothetical protein
VVGANFEHARFARSGDGCADPTFSKPQLSQTVERAADGDAQAIAA